MSETQKLNTVTDLIGNPIKEFAELPDTEEFIVPEDAQPMELNMLSFEQARNVLSGTQGKILTIIDATFTDQDRLKYVKDLVRDAFSRQCDWLFELATKEFDETES